MSKRSQIISLLQTKTVFTVLLILAGISIFRFAREVTVRIKFTKQINELKQQITTLRDEQNNLSSLIEYLGTDAYIESEARQKLSLGKPGEQLIVVPESNTATAVEGGSDSISMGALWWDYFFK